MKYSVYSVKQNFEDIDELSFHASIVTTPLMKIYYKLYYKIRAKFLLIIPSYFLIIIQTENS